MKDGKETLENMPVIISFMNKATSSLPEQVSLQAFMKKVSIIKL